VTNETGEACADSKDGYNYGADDDDVI